MQPDTETLSLASNLIEELAGSALTPAFARLYSHHTRLRENQSGLMSWKQDETYARLDDVILLLEASFVQKQAGRAQWQSAMLRAGELLEWLPRADRSDSEPEIPTKLLSAACYQVAGYPARALGLLQENEEKNIESRILSSFLKADFVGLFDEISKYWSRSTSPIENSQNIAHRDGVSLESTVVKETISALGILCAVMRWGDDFRLQKALSKLSAISKVMLHGQNPYEWMLSKLCAEVARTYAEDSMRVHVQPLLQDVSQNGKEVFERYLRQGYQSSRAVAWPSQKNGIRELLGSNSFALCTPTGSGKTTVAELSILQSLFLHSSNTSLDNSAFNNALVIYLVPSRALATEIEAKLSVVLKNTVTCSEHVTVTGLYGGTDWGPTDAWLTTEEKTILICTYEKAEALMKFLGNFFLHRTALVVIDEAHMVQFGGSLESLQQSENRALRLESLGARLFSRIHPSNCRVVALSAVAEGAERALARWVSQQPDAQPIKTFYKSTRQLIGRLECQEKAAFEIRYDLLDGRSLAFDNASSADSPYIPRPFPPHPQVPQRFEWKNKSKNQRANFSIRVRPYLFWAAMNLATPDAENRHRAVLISISQNIDGYTKDFLDLLNRWPAPQQPNFFSAPTADIDKRMWTKCLDSCADYYTEDSREYQLLIRGVAVHHGKMPGLMARLLVEVIQKGIVHLVIATSTLSEGVNLPFETVLIPNLQRWNAAQSTHMTMSPSEFGNLVGRAGRPGFGTEGRSLVLLPRNPTVSSERKLRNAYFSLINDFKGDQTTEDDEAISPLNTLIEHLRRQWKTLVPLGRDSDFLRWLERTAPTLQSSEEELEEKAIQSLDALDNVLLSAIVEIEQISGHELSPNELEEKLLDIWQKSYAYYASREQSLLHKIFVCRGKAITASIYPNYSTRRRLYKTSLPPRSGQQLLSQYSRIREHLETGTSYMSSSAEWQFNYIRETASLISEVPSFRLENSKGKGKSPDTSWDTILHWWLFHNNSIRQPKATEISRWHKIASENFYYRFNWGLGSVLALAMDEAFGETMLEPSLENWPRIGLPWVAFWMKELVVWGTLDPVASYLLARIDEVTNRSQAESLSQGYYRSVQDLEPNEQLNPRTIRDWTQQAFSIDSSDRAESISSDKIVVRLLRDFSRSQKRLWRVIPIASSSEINWLDPAGFPLATCSMLENWHLDYLHKYDFELDVVDTCVRALPYL